MNLDSASTLQQSFGSYNSLIDLHDISSQHHGSSTSLSSAIHPQHSQEYVKAMRHLTESMKRTEESRSQVIKMLRQSASAANTTPAATVIPEVPQVTAPIAVTPPPLGMDIDCGDSIMDDDEMEDDMMWFIGDDPITTEKFEPLPPLHKHKQFDQELPRQQQPQQPSASLCQPGKKEPSLKYIKLAQFLNGSRGTLTDGLQESRKQLGYEVVWIKNQQCEQRENETW